MTCISAAVTPLLNSLTGSASLVHNINVRASLASYPLQATAEAMLALIPTAHAVLGALDVVCTVVCSVADLHYIYVMPTETQWISETDIALFYVESDTKWRVE